MIYRRDEIEWALGVFQTPPHDESEGDAILTAVKIDTEYLLLDWLEMDKKLSKDRAANG